MAFYTFNESVSKGKSSYFIRSYFRRWVKLKYFQTGIANAAPVIGAAI